MVKYCYLPRMHTRKYYNNTLIPKYLTMLDKLDSGVLGIDVLKNATIDVCNCLNNMLDYFSEENPDYLRDKVGVYKAGQFKKKVFSPNHAVDGAQLNIDYYGYVKNIADCGKHHNIKRYDPQIKSSGDIREVLATIRYSDDDGFYYARKNIVVATDVNGRDWPCEVLIYCAFNFITSVLIDSGVIDSAPNLHRIKRDFYISRSDAAKLTPTKMTGVEGEHFEVQLKCYIYEVHGPLQIRVVRSNDEFHSDIPTTFNVVKGMYNSAIE